MIENPEHLAWIDLETTGSRVQNEEILEVGLAITNANLDIIECASWVVYPDDNTRLLRMDPIVVDMHIKNDLLRTILKTKPSDRLSIEKVDIEVKKVMSKYLPSNNKMPLAGSGVAHFDLRFIEKWMPVTMRHLNYAPYDVGSMRRWFRLAGLTNDIDDSKTHRALDDVMTHIEEARMYMDILRKVNERKDE